MAKIGMTVDILLLSYQRRKTKILLVERRYNPFKGSWALPGGFVEQEETLYQAALRELEEETGIQGLDLMPFRTFDQINRDPRGRTLSQVFFGITTKPQLVKAGSDAKNVRWFALDKLPALAFDHEQIIIAAQKHIQNLYNLVLPLLKVTKPIQVSKLIELLAGFDAS